MLLLWGRKWADACERGNWTGNRISEVTHLQLNDTSYPISRNKYQWLLGCVPQSSYCSSPVKMFWVILNCGVKKLFIQIWSLWLRNLVLFMQIKRFPSPFSLNLILFYFVGIRGRGWGWGGCKTCSKILTCVLQSLEDTFCEHGTKI